MKSRLILLFLLALLAVVPAALSIQVVPGNGWRMDGFNPSRTNQTPVVGPASLPTFQVINANVTGGLRRIGDDGSLVLSDANGVYCYSNTGQLKWSTPLAFIQDVALGPIGTVYVSTFTAVAALDKNTGQPVWPASVVTNYGNESSPLAIDNNGIIYFRTGSSQIGPSPRLTAINPNGTVKWDTIVGFRGYERSILSTDQSVIYISRQQGLSAAAGQVIYTSACGIYDPYVFAPWNLLYTNDFNNVLQALSPDLQSCAAVASGFPFDGIATVTNAGIIVLQSQNFDSHLGAFDQQGNPLWTKTEHLARGFSDGNGVLYVLGNLNPGDGNAVEKVIVAIQSATGQELWRKTFSDVITGMLLGGDGSLYLTAGTQLIRTGGAPTPTPTPCTLTCTATVPTSGTVGSPVSFAATSSASYCIGPPEYRWDFGDGTAPSLDQNPTHTYAAARTYNWSMTVSIGALASCSKSGQVIISQPTPTPTPTPGQFSLSFPVLGKTAYSAPITSVFDHSMSKPYIDKDGIVLAYTGDTGKRDFGPGQLAATVTSGQVAFQWSQTRGNVRYQLFYRVGPTPPANCSGTLIYDNTGTSFVHKNLNDNTTYSYRLCIAEIDNSNKNSGFTLSAKPLANKTSQIAGAYDCLAYKQGSGQPFDFGAKGVFVGASSCGRTNYLTYDGHPGIDYGISYGIAVYPAIDGIVTYDDTSGYSEPFKYHVLTITPTDGSRYKALYLHLSTWYDSTTGKVMRRVNYACDDSKAIVEECTECPKPGDMVRVSDNKVIGYVGDYQKTPKWPQGWCGVAQHLHFEVRKKIGNGYIAVDPYGWQGAPGKDLYPYASEASKSLWK